LVSEPGEPIATVALGERVDPANAPRPSNESERLVFRQLYETLVRADCDGRVGPGLAVAWRLDPSGSAWVVTLREDARFSDGSPVTSADVVSGWSLGDGAELRPDVRRLVRSIVAVDERTLLIALRSLRADAPVALAHTDLAVARRVTGTLWPLGTRPGRVVQDGAQQPQRPSVITLQQLPEPASAIRFLVAPGRDGRDLLDEGIDLLVTRDTTTLNYAVTLPQYAAVPMAWQRTHVLLNPGRTAASPALPAEARESLAHDAVRGEARGAQGPFWWQTLSACEFTYSRPQDPAAAGRIVYDADDAVARDLAERLVALVNASVPGSTAILDALLPDRSKRTYQRAAGLTGEALVAARRRGNEGAYIVALERRPMDSCREMLILAENAGWIEPDAIVPLVDTRLQAIVRRGRSGAVMEWDGGLLIVDGRR
jgi:hypothetical protein